MNNPEIISEFRKGVKRQAIAKAFYNFWKHKDKTLTEKDAEKHVEETILKWWNKENRGEGNV